MQFQTIEKENKMNKKICLLMIGLLLASLILAACGSSAASNFPTGKFVLSDSEYEGIYYNKDGTWSGFAFGQETAKGTYHVKGDLYTEEASPDACPTAATYKYSFDGTNLKFELVGEDSCQNRRESYDGVTYVLSK
jgi:ABC-type oligopeptide transport system substrate-binding subunit